MRNLKKRNQLKYMDLGGEYNIITNVRGTGWDGVG
jgi:hypothetical protein